MSEVSGPLLHHEVRYENEILDLPPVNGWRTCKLSGRGRASCTCGGMDTGYVNADVAYRAAQEHVQRKLPGVDWGPGIDGPALPKEEQR